MHLLHLRSSVIKFLFSCIFVCGWAVACERFHESRHRERKQTRQVKENPTVGIREFRTKRLRKRRAMKINSETAKVLQYCSAAGARLNARTGTSLSIALLLPCPLLPVPGGNLFKIDAGTSLSVSGASRCHFPGHALHEKDDTQRQM